MKSFIICSNDTQRKCIAFLSVIALFTNTAIAKNDDCNRVGEALLNVLSSKEQINDILNESEDIKKCLLDELLHELDSKFARLDENRDGLANPETLASQHQDILHFSFYTIAKLANRGAQEALKESLNKSTISTFFPNTGYLFLHSVWKIAEYTIMSMAVHSPLPFFFFLGKTSIKYGAIFGTWATIKTSSHQKLQHALESENNEAQSFYNLEGMTDNTKTNLFENGARGELLKKTQEHVVTQLYPMIEQKMRLMVQKESTPKEIALYAFTLSEIGVLYILKQDYLDVLYESGYAESQKSSQLKKSL